MEQMKNENSEQINFDEIDEKNLAEEIIVAMRDCFACKIVQSGHAALLHFENGQRFLLSVNEVRARKNPPSEGGEMLKATGARQGG